MGFAVVSTGTTFLFRWPGLEKKVGDIFLVSSIVMERLLASHVVNTLSFLIVEDTLFFYSTGLEFLRHFLVLT